MNHVILSGTVFEPESRVAKSGMAVLTTPSKKRLAGA